MSSDAQNSEFTIDPDKLNLEYCWQKYVSEHQERFGKLKEAERKRLEIVFYTGAMSALTCFLNGAARAGPEVFDKVEDVMLGVKTMIDAIFIVITAKEFSATKAH